MAGKKLIVIFLLSCIFGMNVASATANHLAGLHLQLPDQTIDFKKSDIQEVHAFQTREDSACIMLKLQPAKAEDIFQLTEKAVGKSILWIWNGRVLAMEELKAPIEGDLTVPNLKPYEAEEFEKDISR